MSTGLFLRYFYTAEFFPKKAVLREYVTEFAFVFLNPFAKNRKNLLRQCEKRRFWGAIYIKNVSFWEKELICTNLAFYGRRR